MFISGKKEKVVVRSKDYQSKLVEQGNLNFIATGKVQETGRIITAMRVVTVHNPKLTVQVWYILQDQNHETNSKYSSCRQDFKTYNAWTVEL